jgi:hypothetical protein
LTPWYPTAGGRIIGDRPTARRVFAGGDPLVIRALDRKLLRDLARLKTQAVAIALVVASGVASFVATVTTYRSLRVSEDRYSTRALGDDWAGASEGEGPSR